jgi:hypothetical protein
MSVVTVKTQRITREKLAALTGGNQQLIRLLENLTADMTVTIPDALDAVGVPVTEFDALVLRVSDLEQQVQELEAELLAARRIAQGIDELRRAVSELQALTLGV